MGKHKVEALGFGVRFSGVAQRYPASLFTMLTSSGFFLSKIGEIMEFLLGVFIGLTVGYAGFRGFIWLMNK